MHAFALCLLKLSPLPGLFVKGKIIFLPNMVILCYSIASFYSRMIKDHVDKYNFLLGPDDISATMPIFISIL